MNRREAPGLDTRELGQTALQVTGLCFGTSALGNFPSQYGYEVSTDRALDTLREIFEGPVNFLDTSNNYGDGESERRIGQALAAAGGLPEGFVIATKVDPAPGREDFSGTRVRASAQESLQRLGVESLDLLYLHDPERISFAEATSDGGAVEALVALREEGIARHIGVAGGPIELMRDYLVLGVFEAVISHNRYTLIDRSAEPLIADAAQRGIAFVNAAPYGGGMLVKGPEAQPKYRYELADEQTVARVRVMDRACRAHDVPLPAAALQFSLRDPRVASTIVGISTPERVSETLALAEHRIPEELWGELLAL
jgi:D-threo-aldose 1-dehydrogenase